MIRVKYGFGGLLAVLFIASVPRPAFAEERVDSSVDRRDDPVRVQVGINSFFPGPTGESDDAIKLRERVRRSIYEMAAGECGLVQQTLSKTCRLESVNVSLNRQPNGQIDGYAASGNFVLRITLK